MGQNFITKNFNFGAIKNETNLKVFEKDPMGKKIERMKFVWGRKTFLIHLFMRHKSDLNISTSILGATTVRLKVLESFNWNFLHSINKFSCER